MMFFGGDDDDADFTPRDGNSKLASLFGLDKAAAQTGNETLKYQAPKEPKKDVPPSGQASTQPSVLHAVATHAYKFTDGKYTSQGKLGTAIIGNHVTREYKLLLYLSKTQQITHSAITKDFIFTVQPNNYAAFYDHAQQNWSIMFDTDVQKTTFVKQVALAQANSLGPSLDCIIIQDVKHGEGGGLELGDSVELKYTAWVVTDNTIGDMVESNSAADKLLRFKVGKGKVIKGLDEGVLGMQKSATRILIFPPIFGYGTEVKGDIPPSATLMYEIEAVRVKLAKVTESAEADVPTAAPTSLSAPAPTATPGGPPEKTVAEVNVTDLDEVKDVKNSAEMTAPRPDKAKLISRIARMGQAMFPVHEPTSPAPSVTDSEYGTVSPSIEEHAGPSPKPSLPSKPVLPHYEQTVPKPVHLVPDPIRMSTVYPQAYPYTTQFQVPITSQMALYQPGLPMMHQAYGTIPQQMVPPVSDSSVPILLSETRSQTTEMRLTLGKVADKVDRISEKLDQMCSNQHQQSHAVAMTPHLEASIIMHNIQRIMEENDRLKKEVLEKSAKIEQQNEKISTLLERSQQYLEKSTSMMERSSNSFNASAFETQAKVLALEQDKGKLTTEITSLSTQLSSSQVQLSAAQTTEAELRAQLDSTQRGETKQKDLIQKLKLKCAEAEQGSEQLTAELRDEKKKRKQLESELKTLKQEMAALKQASAGQDKSQAHSWSKDKDELIKKHEAQIADLKASMKEKYETRIQELEKKGKVPGITAKDEMAVKVKQIMSSVFHELKVQFDAETLYKGQEINKNIMDTIKSVTVRMMNEDDDDEIMEVETSQNSSATVPTGGVFKPETVTTGDHGNSHKSSEVNTAVKQLVKADKAAPFIDTSKPDSDTENKAVLEDVISVLVAPKTGDKGNQHYAKELKQAAKQKETTPHAVEQPLVAVACMTTSAPTPAAANVDDTETEIVEEMIAAAVSNVVGGRGNPYYAAELSEAEEKHKVLETSTEKPDPVFEEVIEALVSRPSGDKGNPHYAAELQQHDSVGKKMVSSSVSTTSAGKQPTTKTPKPQTTKTAAKQPTTETPANQPTTKTPAKPPTTETPAKPPTTKTPKPQTTKTAAKQPTTETIAKQPTTETPAKQPTTKTPAKPPTTETPAKTPTQDPILDEVIEAMVSHATGDKGNPHYAAELHKPEILQKSTASKTSAGKPCQEAGQPESVVGDPMDNVIEALISHSTGDKGNPHYAEQLQKGDKKEELFSSKSTKPDELTEKVTALQHLISVHEQQQEIDQLTPHIVGQEGAVLGDQEVIIDLIVPITAPVTGDKGNTYRSEELDRQDSEPIPMIACVDATSPTGGRGNPHREEEILKRVAEEKSAKVDGHTDEKLTGSKSDSSKAAGKTKPETPQKDKMAAGKPTPKTSTSESCHAVKTPLKQDFDDDMKPKPPPLFDDQDDDDSDWLK